MLLADGKVSAHPLFQEAAADIHEKEVNRLLIWVAIAVRQLLAIDQTDEEQSCGILWNDFPDGTKDTLTFRKACDKIIHANEIIACRITYDPIPDDPDESSVKTGESPLQGDFTLVIVAETIGATTWERGRPALDEGKMPSLPGLLRAEVRLLLSVKWPWSPLRYYAGTITIRTTASKRYKASRCELDFETFAGDSRTVHGGTLNAYQTRYVQVPLQNRQ